MIALDMKISSRKLLLFLYSWENAFFSGNYDHFRYVLPEMSEAGRRSSLHLLVKKGYLLRRMADKKASFALTRVGYQVVEQIYPFLKEEKAGAAGEYEPEYCLILQDRGLNGSKKRQLHQLLRSYQAAGKGSVFFLRELPIVLLKELTHRYTSVVTIHRIKEWIIGGVESLTSSYSQFLALEMALSGISREFDQLLINKIRYKVPNHQSNLTIFSAFDRTFALFEQLAGTAELSSRKISSSRRVLEQFHKLFS